MVVWMDTGALRAGVVRRHVGWLALLGIAWHIQAEALARVLRETSAEILIIVRLGPIENVGGMWRYVKRLHVMPMTEVSKGGLTLRGVVVSFITPGAMISLLVVRSLRKKKAPVPSRC